VSGLTVVLTNREQRRDEKQLVGLGEKKGKELSRSLLGCLREKVRDIQKEEGGRRAGVDQWEAKQEGTEDRNKTTLEEEEVIKEPRAPCRRWERPPISPREGEGIGERTCLYTTQRKKEK